MWQPIETAPRGDRPVLVTIAGPENYWPHSAIWDNQIEKWVIAKTDKGKKITLSMDPTHWKELDSSPLN